MKWKRWVLGITAILLLLCAGFLLSLPKARASLRLTPGFKPLPDYPRVYAETGGEDAARRFAASLSDVLKRIEAAHGRPFKPEFRVYVCASHRSFCRWMMLPAGAPVMGSAFPRDIWLSPRLLDVDGRDRHKEGMGHELSHMHMNQWLGWLGRTRGIPAWFGEGLADWSSGWEADRVSRQQALFALKNGPRMTQDDTGHLPLAKTAADYGVSWPMLHRQSQLFIEYLVKTDETAFRGFLSDIQNGKPFGPAFEDRFGQPVNRMFDRFVNTI